IDGSTEMFSLDVPERDVDAAQALDDDAFLTVIAQARVDRLPQEVGAQRILTDQPRSHAPDDRGRHQGGAVAFSPSHETVIGLDLDEHGGPRAVPRARIGEGL